MLATSTSCRHVFLSSFTCRPWLSPSSPPATPRTCAFAREHKYSYNRGPRVRTVWTTDRFCKPHTLLRRFTFRIPQLHVSSDCAPREHQASAASSSAAITPYRQNQPLRFSRAHGIKTAKNIANVTQSPIAPPRRNCFSRRPPKPIANAYKTSAPAQPGRSCGGELFAERAWITSSKS